MKTKINKQFSAADEQFESVAMKLLVDSNITKSKMFGSTGLKINGKYFVMIYKEKLVVKLPKEQVDALVLSGKGRYFDPGHGRLMKEWIEINSGSENEWIKLATEAKEFVKKIDKRR